MIYSMTAFANTISQSAIGTFHWEMRSVNHRYLELTLRLPEFLRTLEPILRDNFRQQVARGKIECTLKYQPNPAAVDHYQLNLARLKQLADTHEQIKPLWPNLLPPTTIEILNWPHILQTTDEANEAVQTAALDTFQQTLQNFIAKRHLEGQALGVFLEEKLTVFRQQFIAIKQLLPQLETNQKQKLYQRFAEIQPEVDQNRFAQEVTFLLQKMDVAEELSRIEIHSQEIQKILQQGGLIGKRLDFLLQELNRETNTLSVKLTAAQTTLAAIELKVAIEQMREQVQNIE